MALRRLLARIFGHRSLTPEELAELPEAGRIRSQMREDRLSQTSRIGQVYRSGESRSERDERF